VSIVSTLLGFSEASRGCKSLPTLSCSATRQSILDLRTLLLSLDSKHCNKKVKNGDTALFRNPSQSYGASPAIWDHTVLPATWHRWTRLTLTQARQASTWFTYPGGTKGWVDLGGWLHTKMVYHLPARRQSPIALLTRPGVE